MKASTIRYNQKNGGGKPTPRFLEDLCKIIVSEADRKGFKTDSYRLTGTSIKIGLHMSSFRIDTEKLGHNARTGHYVSSPKGYKRTDVPTWDQRVEFNDLVNRIFNKFGLVSTIKSGCFTVRDRTRAHTERDWETQVPSWMGYQGASLNGMGQELSRIMTEKEAREYCDSDRLEKEHAEKTRPERLAKAKEYRKRVRLFKISKKVVVDGFWSYNSKPNKNGKELTHLQFEKLLSKVSEWEKRRVRAASIAATARRAEGLF